MKSITDVLATEETEPQLIEGMVLSDYLELPHLSGSPLSEPSMLHLRHKYETAQKTTDAMRKGAIADAYVFDILVPAVRSGRALTDALDEADEEFPVFGGTRRGSKWDEFHELHGEHYFTKYEERQEIVGMAVHIINNPVARPYWDEGLSQCTLLASEYGIRVKGRPDWISMKMAIVDMKTTAQLPRASYTVRDFGYHTKMALYRRWLRRVTGNELPCVLIFVEQSPPHDVVVMPIDETTLSLREEQALQTLERLRQCIEEDVWPGISQGAEVPYEPSYAEMDELAFQEVE